MSGAGTIIQTPQDAQPVIPGGAVIAPAAITQKTQQTAPAGPANSSVQANAVIPAIASAPNVNGGAASFSDMTGAIQSLISAKTAAINASADALVKNNAVDKQTSAALSGVQTDTLTAYQNIEKTAGLPGGPSGSIAKILSLFDSDYNFNVQKVKIDENQIRASQITATADAIKQQNNELPALMANVAEANSAVVQAQVQVNQLAINKSELDVHQQQARQEAIRTRIALSQEQRQQADFLIQSKSMDQLAQMSNDPKYANIKGLIDHRLISEKNAEVSLHAATTAAQQGDMNAYNANSLDFVSHLPADLIQPLLAQAQKTGAATVEFPTGVDPKTKKPTTISIPIPIVEQGLVKNVKIEADANQAVAADYIQRSNLVPNVKGIVTSASALSSIDPRATSVVQNTTQVMASLDPKNPNNVRQVSAIIDAQKDQIAQIAKDVSTKFGTPEAKAAVVQFGTTGKFDATGGTAVIADSVGIPALPSQTLYNGAFKVLNQQLAQSITAQHLAPTIADGSQATAQQILAGLSQKADGKESIRQLTQEALANPQVQKKVASNIAGVVRPKAVNDVLQGMASQKNANPIWKELYDHPEQVMSQGTDKDGKPTGAAHLDYQKLFQVLEQHRIETGGKVNYSAAFITAMKNYAINADNTSSADPRYTIYDHALEAAIFGGRPHQAILSDFIGQLMQQQAQTHAAMQERIRQDISGQTQHQAAQMTNGAVSLTNANMPISDQEAEAYQKKTGFNPATVPSATGTKLTAEQVKRLFGGGQ